MLSARRSELSRRFWSEINDGSVTTGVGVSPHFFRQHKLEKSAVLTPPPAVTDRFPEYFVSFFQETGISFPQETSGRKCRPQPTTKHETTPIHQRFRGSFNHRSSDFRKTEFDGR